LSDDAGVNAGAGGGAGDGRLERMRRRLGEVFMRVNRYANSKWMLYAPRWDTVVFSPDTVAGYMDFVCDFAKDSSSIEVSCDVDDKTCTISTDVVAPLREVCVECKPWLSDVERRTGCRVDEIHVYGKEAHVHFGCEKMFGRDVEETLKRIIDWNADAWTFKKARRR